MSSTDLLAVAAPPGPRPRSALELREVVKTYAGRQVLHGVDLHLAPGRVHALLGPNGAGKTTLLKIVLGLARPDSGTVAILGSPGHDAARSTESGVAGFVDDPRFWPNLTAEQNLRLLAELDGRAAHDLADRVAAALDGVGLAGCDGLRVSGFSLGMRQRLGLAAALLRRPRLLVLDEPANGLDPDAATELWTMLRVLAAAGTAVLLSSHDLVAVDAIADDVTVLREGRVVWSGPLPILRAQAPDPLFVLHTADDDAAAGYAARAGLLVDARPADRGPGAVPTGGPPPLDMVAAATAAGPAVTAVTAVTGAAGAAAGLRLRATVADLEEFTVALGRAGVGVRSLIPGTPPLRTLFTALTTGDAQLSLPAARPGQATASVATDARATGPASPDPGDAPGGAPGDTPAHVPALLRAAVATEARRLVRQARVRLMLTVCVLAPVAFALVVGLTGTVPADTLYGRWLTESGAALPLVVLAFAASWAFPLLGSVVAGDLLAAEDRLGTWPTLLTRSARRRTLLVAKCLVAAASTVICVVLLGGSSAICGRLLAGNTPLVGLSGQQIPPGRALALVAAAWAASLPTALAWTALALVLSALTRTAIVGIAGPAVLGVIGQLATLVDGPPVLRRLLLSSTLEGWHGLAEIPASPAQLVTGIVVGLGWAVLGGVVLALVLARRDPVDSRGGA